MELANGMEDSSLFVREILESLFLLENVIREEDFDENPKETSHAVKKTLDNRMLLGNKFKKMSCWQNQWVMIIDHQASLDFLFNN